MKSLLFVTGTRADFGKLKSKILALQSSPDYEAYVFATGMHLLEKFGLTYYEILGSGIRHVFPYMNQVSGTPMDEILSNTISGLSKYLKETKKVDAIIVHGDRVEALASAIVGILNHIPVIHIEGGEVSGTVDEMIRHSVSKLSTIHLVANDAAKSQLIKMDECAERIFVVGSADIDIMLSDSLPTLDDVRKRYDINFGKFAIVIYHPVVTEIEKINIPVENIINYIKNDNNNFIVIMPNNDTGGEYIYNKFNVELANCPNVKLYPSLRFEYFLSLLKHAEFILGNSSAGIREAPVYGTPTINIGSRQNGRSISPTIRSVADDGDLFEATRNCTKNNFFDFNFGKGDATKNFMDLLNSGALDKINIQK